jgi:peptidoglycan/xylan/chitin deacetylase (PgdA/CDA1 family)
VTFDNLGEAAEQELGQPTPTGGHYSVLTALPIVLEELADANIPATFFVEGVNADTYPEALRSILAGGHEIAYHAWHHEEWALLNDEQEKANLARGLAAMRALDIDPAGFRPPGGLLGKRTLELLEAEGLSYCSPAGTGAGIERIVLLPFSWPAVDVYHVLPQFEALRAHIDGTREPGGPQRVAETLIASVQEAIATGTHAALVLHTWLVEAERDAVRAVLGHVHAAANRGEIWVARCEDAARWIRQNPGNFTDTTTLDTTSWLDPS